jgi:hypothetical protein
MLTKRIEMKSREHIGATAHSFARPTDRTRYSSPDISAKWLRDADACVNCRGSRKYSVDSTFDSLGLRHVRAQGEASDKRHQ